MERLSVEVPFLDTTIGQPFATLSKIPFISVKIGMGAVSAVPYCVKTETGALKGARWTVFKRSIQLQRTELGHPFIPWLSTAHQQEL
jgi:hypothetical protein